MTADRSQGRIALTRRRRRPATSPAVAYGPLVDGDAVASAPHLPRELGEGPFRARRGLRLARPAWQWSESFASRWRERGHARSGGGSANGLSSSWGHRLSVQTATRLPE